MSQKFVKKAFLMRDRSSEPRQGRQRVAQGVGPGRVGPHPTFGTPLPPGGRGFETAPSSAGAGRVRGWTEHLAPNA